MADLNNNKSLPPSKASSTRYGHLTLTIQGLTFFKQNNQNCIIKLLFWGETTPAYIPLYSSQTFQIVSAINMFKRYLVDCKATQFEIVDSRNFKPIACAFLNWTAYLRAFDDRQTYVDKQENNKVRDRTQIKTYFLPFFDEILQETLPIYHFTANSQGKRQQKIGELKVKWSCRMFQPEVVQSNTNNAPNFNSGQNLYNIRASQISNNNKDRKNETGPDSICNIQIQDDPNQDVRTNGTILLKQSLNSSKRYTTEYPVVARKSNVSILQNYAGRLKKVREETEIDQSRTSIDRGKGINQLDLQLIRMRMEMEELVGPSNKKIQPSILQIVHFQVISKGFSIKQLNFCDIKSQGSTKGSHWRIFPQNLSQGKLFFNSTLSIKPGSLLSFSLGMKKGKETYKGSMPIDCIRDNYDINIISSLGSIVGYLRVVNERKTQITVKQMTSQPKKQKIQENINKPLPLLTPAFSKVVNNSIKIAQDNYKSQKAQDPQSFFLFNIQIMKKCKHKELSFKVFDVMISQHNPQKIAFVSQREYINKPLLINIYQKEKQLYQQVLIKQLKKTAFANVNLTCSLIFQKMIQQIQINCQLYVGNLKQINYFIQKLSVQPQWREQRQVRVPQLQLNHPIKTQQSNKNSIIGQYQMQNMQQQRRKMKTEAIGLEDRDRRLTEQKVSGQSVAMEKFQMHSQNQGNQDENIYLVDLLTRFLDFLPENILPQVPQLPKQGFIELLTPKLKTSNFQIELVQIIISIFQDMNGDNLSIVQLVQCQKAYRSFFNIYHQQKQTTIKQILQSQPRAVQRIRNNSQFGTLNESMLWGRALNKIKDGSIKLKLNKFYKISSFGTTDAAPLLDDLQLKGKELRPLDISNLGMMIKDWVQQFISNAQLENILNIKQKLLSSGEQDNYLNIRSISDVIELTLELRLSLWQSLMLIQEIKGSYGCDLELEEGVISGPSLLNWIDGVRKRTRQKTDNSRLSNSHASLDPEELALIKQINNQNKNDYDLKRKEIAHRSESRSMVGVNNDSDIADIANLLREKDGLMQLELMQQTKIKHIRENQSLAADQRIIKDSLRIQDENLEIIMNKRKKQENKQIIPAKMQKNQKQKECQKVAKLRQNLKQMKFYLQVKQFKIYNEKMPQKLIKALFLLQNANSQPSQDSFFYLTSKNNFSQANQSIIKYCIDKTSKFQHKGIKIVLNDQNNELMYNGFLPFEDINDWFLKNQSECKRTIVLYEGKGKIGGKLVVNLMLNNQRYEKDQQNVNRMNISQKINLTLHNVTPSLKGLKLFARSTRQQRLQLRLNQQTQITFNKPIYQSELTIEDDSQTSTAIISLQQLYLKHYINQSYPLIDVNGGNFIATITITLTYNYTGPNIHENFMKKQFQQNFDYLIPKQDNDQQKRTIMLQIDDIYKSLKMRSL